MKLGELIMTWGTLGHSKDVEPLLVKLYDSHRQYQLAENRTPETRAELSHTVSGLLDLGLTQSERELVSDILINLMRQAEKDLRLAMADRLAAHANVPLRLVLFLAQDEIGVAESVLRQSPVLNDLDLLYIIQSRDSDYWRVIASRRELNEPVIDALVDTNDVPTVSTLAENTQVTLTDYALDAMAKMAETWKDVARPLMARPEIPEPLARKLYELVGKEFEKTIQSALQNELSVLESVKDILYEFSAEAQSEYMPTPAMAKAAAMFFEKGQLSSALMLKTLKRGQIPSFIAQISAVSKISHGRVIDILKQENGCDLAVVCSALKTSRDEFIGIYLMTNKMRGDAHKVNTVEFNRALAQFESLHPAEVTRLFTSLRSLN